MDVSDETENLPVTTVVPDSINAQEQLDGSGDYLPVILGVPFAVIILIIVVSVIIYKWKAGSYDAEAA